MVKTSPGNRLIPRHLEYRLRNSNDLSGVLGDRRQMVKLDDVRYEAFLMLDFHCVEDAAVAVDADEEILRLDELTQRELGVYSRSHAWLLPGPPVAELIGAWSLAVGASSCFDGRD